MSAFEAWKLIRRLADENGVELFGEIRYDRDRDELIVPLRRGRVYVSVPALDGVMPPDEWIKRAVFRI